MRTTILRLFVLATVTGTLVGCEAAKSSNPTSPSVAGPIPGVNITTPKLLEPGNNWSIQSTEQPITLLIENASSNGQRTVSYLFEVATDVAFGSKVFTREGVAAGTGGRTSLKLPDALSPDRTYYWRAKATDGANSSDYSAASAFAVVTPAVITPPTPLSPIGGTTLSTNKAEFVVRNAVKSGPTGQTSYVFEISQNESFTSIVAIVTIPETIAETRLALANDLAYSTRYFWRVRAYDPNTTSSWSATQTFLTPAAPVIPTPSPAPSPAPGGGWPTTGPAVAAYVESRYPERLVPTASLDQRLNNMAFLRDRMIEAGICGGMQLALNLKRGGPDISIDFLTHRKNGVWVGVDIGLASKVYGDTLRLQWADVGPDGVFPTAYGSTPTCK